MFEIITIAGRPNVGKSTLFNRIISKKRAIVHPIAGTTRDYIESYARWGEKEFLIVDTGGWQPHTKDRIHIETNAMLERMLKRSSAVIFLTDAKDGLTPVDEEFARYLRQLNKNVYLAVNKVDSAKKDLIVNEFLKLGFENIVGISALSGRNVDLLLDEVCRKIKGGELRQKEDSIKFIILGRPNSGKSTLLNKLICYERTIVDEKAGTTRESIDITFNYNSKKYTAIDTPGITRKKKYTDFLEYLSALSVNKFINRADLAILLIDATTGITKADESLAGLIKDASIGCLVAINKWDLIKDRERYFKSLTEEFNKRFDFLSWAKFITISAKTGIRVSKIFENINSIYESYNFRFNEIKVLEVLTKAVYYQPLVVRGKKFSVESIKKVSTAPPTIDLIVSDPTILNFSYRRYLLNSLRRVFPLEGTPINLHYYKR